MKGQDFAIDEKTELDDLGLESKGGKPEPATSDTKPKEPTDVKLKRLLTFSNIASFLALTLSTITWISDQRESRINTHAEVLDKIQSARQAINGNRGFDAVNWEPPETEEEFGSLSNAKTNLEQAQTILRLHPNADLQREINIQVAILDFRNRHYSRAIHLLESENSKDEAILFALGLFHHVLYDLAVSNSTEKEKHLHSAVSYFEQAAKLPDCNRRVFYNLALLYAEQGDHRKCIKFFEKSAEYYPADSDISHELAHAYLQIGSLAQTVIACTTTIPTDYDFCNAAISASSYETSCQPSEYDELKLKLEAAQATANDITDQGRKSQMNSSLALLLDMTEQLKQTCQLRQNSTS